MAAVDSLDMVSMAELSKRTGIEFGTLKTWHYSRDKFPAVPTGNRDGRSFLWSVVRPILVELAEAQGLGLPLDEWPD